MVCLFQHIVTCLCCQPRTFCWAGIPLFWPPATYFTASPALFRHRGHCLSPCWQCHCHTDIGPECGISRHCVTQESDCLHAHCHTALWHTFDSTHQLLPLTLAFVLPAKPILNHWIPQIPPRTWKTKFFVQMAVSCESKTWNFNLKRSLHFILSTASRL